MTTGENTRHVSSSFVGRGTAGMAARALNRAFHLTGEYPAAFGFAGALFGVAAGTFAGVRASYAGEEAHGAFFGGTLGGAGGFVLGAAWPVVMPVAIVGGLSYKIARLTE